MFDNLRWRTLIPGFPCKIGGVEVENSVWLAPMAGITFSSVRRFFRALGAGLTHTEMVSALGLCHKGRKTRELLYSGAEERPLVFQVFGSDADSISRGAAAALEIRKFDAVEVNMACPMPKVTKKGSGSKLLENPAEACAIIRALKDSGLPVWSKIRLMPGNGGLATEDFCCELFAAGADFIFVHGRTAAQRYDGSASREAVCSIARSFPGLIGGTGDCFTPAILKEYLDGGCASVLAGRGFLKDAFIIPKTLHLLGAEVPEEFIDATGESQARILLELGRSVYNTEGQSSALMIVRRMLAALFKGTPGASQLRRRGALVRNWGEMEALLLDPAAAMADTEELKKEFYPHGVIE